MRARWLSMLVVSACSTLGAETAFPDPVQTSGVGPIRPLDSTETGLADEPAGLALQTDHAVDSPSPIDDVLFFASAAPLDSPPDRDPELLSSDVDWNRFEPREIRRATRSGDMLGYAGAEVVLSATETWEGDAVFDPAILMMEDGSTRLYYAAEQGIGLAEASSPTGSFSKVAGPIVSDARSPAVARTSSGEWVMFFESDQGIGLALSDDGQDWTVEVESLRLTRPADDDESTPDEVRARRPGAIVAPTPIGSEILRVYYELVFDDGTTSLAVSGQRLGEGVELGRRMQRATKLVFEDGDPGAPRAWLGEDWTTMVLFTRALEQGDSQTRAIAIGVAPAHVRFADPPPEPAEEE